MIPLDKNKWLLRRSSDGSTIPVRIPGDNISALLKAEKIPDPYYGKNELDLQWIGREEWSFINTFDYDLEQNSAPRLLLESVDTLGEVFLNGISIGKTENMFRAYTFDTAGAVKEGVNNLEIRIASAEQKAVELAKTLPYPYPHSEYPVQSPHRNLIRKTQCHAGWDWGPALMGSGLYGKTALLPPVDGRIEGVHTDLVLREGVWELTVHTELHAPAPCEVRLTAACAGEEVSETLRLSGGTEEKAVTLKITKPELWWPAGYGDQPLYNLEVSTGTDCLTKKIGFRSLEVLTEDDEKGTGLVFQVNGRKIFCKGANWIPIDALPARETEERYETLLTSAVKANMNMIRVWGGGKYEEDIFYELCDSLGLLIWQDFMFACSLYPADPKFLENVKGEVEYQIKRLKNHPSLALWCGNNENVGSINWFEESKNNRDRYLIDYYKLNEAVIGNTVKDLDPGRKWWSSSPSAGEGDFSDCWHDDSRGDMHYWSVWHEGKPFEAYYEVIPRFCSEFGFQSFSSLETVKTFAEEEQWNITSPVMEHHQKNDRGNTIIATTLSRYFRFPGSFGETLYLSGVQQAMAITTAVEYWRTKKPICMGALYWQLNDNWPVASWSSLEYSGRWKPLHHAARRFFAPLHLVILKEEENLRIFGCSDRKEDIKGTLTVQLLDFQGNTAEEYTKECCLPGDASALLEEKALSPEEYPADEYFCRAVFTPEKGGGSSLTNSSLLAPPKACALPECRLKIKAEEGTDGREFIITTDKPAFYVWLETAGTTGEFSDNCFHLVPGEEKRLRFEGAALNPQEINVSSLRNYQNR